MAAPCQPGEAGWLVGCVQGLLGQFEEAWPWPESAEEIAGGGEDLGTAVFGSG